MIAAAKALEAYKNKIVFLQKNKNKLGYLYCSFQVKSK